MQNSMKKYMLPLLMAVILLYSGTLFHMSSNIQMQFGMLLIATAAFIITNKRGLLGTLVRAKDPWCVLFLYLLMLSIGINMIIESNPIKFALLFLYEFLLFLIGYMVVIVVPYQRFKSVFINFMTIIAGISIVCWLMPEVIKSIALFRYNRTSWQFASLYVYNLNMAVPTRNCGFCWEPGLYQAYLNFALFLIIISEKKKYDWMRMSILAIAVITTFSSTGYIILVILSLLQLFQGRNSIRKMILALLVIILGFAAISNLNSILLFIDRYTMYSVAGKFYSAGNESVATRLYSGLCDLDVAILSPFGADRSAIEILRAEAASKYGNITASTNTFTAMLLYFGWLPGIAYAILWIRGCLRVQKTFFNRLLVLFMMASILMTSLHIDLWFFTIIMMYWNSRYCNELVEK